MLAYFEKLESMTMLIVEMLLANQQLCKLIYYKEYNPLAEPDLPDTRILLNDRIFPLPKQPNSDNKQTAIVNTYFECSEPYQNSGFRQVFLRFDIMCSLDVWMIDNGVRPYAISHNIDKMFNDKLIPELSIKAVRFTDWKNARFSDAFYGYSLWYELSNLSNVGCEYHG